MRSRIAVLLLLIAIACSASAEDETDQFSESKQNWTRRLEQEKFRFPDRHATVVDSLINYRGDGQVQLLYDGEKARGAITIRFVRDTKVLAEFRGHAKSAFVERGGTLYFVRYGPHSSGASLVAYDMRRGKELWTRNVEGLGPVEHSAYVNSVVIEDVNGDVRVLGRESFGDYAEVFEGKTGERLAHKIYERH
jgi:outer membrane protein assembly factor BamB